MPDPFMPGSRASVWRTSRLANASHLPDHVLPGSSQQPVNGTHVQATKQSKLGGLSVLKALASVGASCFRPSVEERAALTKERSKRYCEATADFAQKHAQAKIPNSHYKILCARMCWDAVKYCIWQSGMINKKTHNNLNGYQLVSPVHPRIDSAEAMARVPRGHVLGFFKFGDVFKSEDEIQDNDTPPRTHSLPFHVMISTGQGHAAGNKNSCIGMGHEAIWEELDLRTLAWSSDKTVVAIIGKDPNDGSPMYHRLLLTHRPTSDLASSR